MTEQDPSHDPEDVDRPATSAGVVEYKPAPPKHDAYAAFRHRSYVILAIGWLIAAIGHAAQATAIGWEIFDRTGSKAALGYIAGVQAIPLLVLALPAGHLADTFDRRRIIAISSLCAGACSVLLSWLSYRDGSIPYMYVVIVLATTALVLGRPARSSLMPRLVPPEVFANAVAWNSSAHQIATVIGPALGGALVWLSLRWLGSAALAYAFEACCVTIFAISMLFIRMRPVEQAEKPDRSLLAGMRFVFRNRIVLTVMSLDLFAVLLGGATYLLPVFAIDILKIDSRGFGWLRAAEAIGALMMTLTLAHLPPMKHAGRAILLAVAGYGAATIIFGLSTQFWLSFLMLVMIGMFDSISVVIRHTLVQLLTPDDMRGRVAAVNNIFVGASNELGGLESGLLAAWIGAVGAVVVGGFGTIAIVGAIAWGVPELRRLGSLDRASLQRR